MDSLEARIAHLSSAELAVGHLAIIELKLSVDDHGGDLAAWAAGKPLPARVAAAGLGSFLEFEGLTLDEYERRLGDAVEARAGLVAELEGLEP